MIQIPQHGESESLNDLNDLIPIVDKHFQVDKWMIEVEECVGEQAAEIVQKTRSGLLLTSEELRAMYAGIYQTINGIFSAYSRGVEVVNLIAIDSTCWEVASPNAKFIEAVKLQFGTYPP